MIVVTENKLRTKLIAAVEQLRTRMYRDDFYSSSPSWIALYITKDADIEVRTHEGSGGFMDELHNEAEELCRMDTSNYRDQVDDLISTGVTTEQCARLENESLQEVLGSKEYDSRVENCIDNSIENTFFVENMIGIAISFLENRELDD